MARLSGGIFSRPSGHNNGLVFGKGRTRHGKVTTVREHVIPHNPKTPKQQAQRGRFGQAVLITRGIGRDVYREPFNKAIGQLPGYQSLVSYFTDALSEDGVTLAMPQTLNLGEMPTPVISNVSVMDDVITVGWEAQGGPGTDSDDTAVLIAVEVENDGFLQPVRSVSDTSSTRSGGTGTITAPVAGENPGYVGLFFISANPDAIGKERFSPIVWQRYN